MHLDHESRVINRLYIFCKFLVVFFNSKLFSIHKARGLSSCPCQILKCHEVVKLKDFANKLQTELSTHILFLLIFSNFYFFLSKKFLLTLHNVCFKIINERIN